MYHVVCCSFGRGPGKVRTICWQTQKEHIASDPSYTSLKTEPFAAFEQALGLPEQKRAQLTQCLQLLANDRSKLYDVRILRGFVLNNIAVGAYKALELDLTEHEVCPQEERTHAPQNTFKHFSHARRTGMRRPGCARFLANELRHML